MAPWCTGLARPCWNGCATIPADSRSPSLSRYLLPTVDVVPSIEIHHMESPTPLNPLGVKGAAESGAIGAPAAIVSAIEDALRPLEVRIRELPVTPARLRALIQAATPA